MAVGAADHRGRLVRHLEDRKIQIGGGSAGVSGRPDLQIISCSSSSKAGALQEECSKEKESTKDGEGESTVGWS